MGEIKPEFSYLKKKNVGNFGNHHLSPRITPKYWCISLTRYDANEKQLKSLSRSECPHLIESSYSKLNEIQLLSNDDDHIFFPFRSSQMQLGETWQIIHVKPIWLRIVKSKNFKVISKAVVTCMLVLICSFIWQVPLSGDSICLKVMYNLNDSLNTHDHNISRERKNFAFVSSANFPQKKWTKNGAKYIQIKIKLNSNS